MSTTTNLDMHRDHRDWDFEACFWRDDVRAWQHELAQARTELQNLDKILTDRERALCVHAAAIRLHADKPQQHEQQIVAAERSSGANPYEAGEHADEAVQQAVDRETHERIKRHHHEFISQWRLLLAALARREWGVAASRFH